MRKAGLLIPVASLPSPYGIGDFGKSSYQLVDLLKKAGFKIWQILPLNPLGFGNSPYQPYSSKAMDELYISLDLLKEEGLIKKTKTFNKAADKIAYGDVRKFKEPYLREAFSNFKKDKDYEEFVSDQWVRQFAVFLTLKHKNNNQCWTEWNKKDKEWIKKPFDLKELNDEVEYQMFIQYILYKQWIELRQYANKQGIEIMGDLPIYVGIDSLDVWSYQKGFLLDKDGRPTFIAGVPPDFFSATGQRWGNPIYDWKKQKKDGFTFWLDRLSYNSKLFDIVRIDHFRAFDTYWKIPASCETAIDGEWVEAPGYDLFDTIYKTYPDIRIVVEDLGDLRPEVFTLRDHYDLTGMRIVQCSFDPDKEMEDRENLLAYTGTHDNQTLRSWYAELSDLEKNHIRKFFKRHGYNHPVPSLNMIQYTLDTKAKIAVIPMIDLLNKNDSCRLNRPGTVGDPNWQWKMKDFKEFENNIELYSSMIKRAKR